jgi:hypothetical protein
VVDVPVGHQHRDRLEVVLAHHLRDAVGGVLAGVDHDALAAGAGRDDVAVGAPRSCGKAGDEHEDLFHTRVRRSGTSRVSTARLMGLTEYRRTPAGAVSA